MTKSETGWATMPAGKLLAAESKFRAELGPRGADILTRLDDDSDFRRRSIEFMLRGAVELPMEERLLRAVMGRNCFLSQDWTLLYNVGFTKKQLREIPKFPCDEGILNSPCHFVKGKRVLDTHFGFLGISALNGAPLTVAKLLELCPANLTDRGQPKFYFNNDPWNVGQPHTDVATMQLRWYLLLKDIVPDSTYKTPEDQVAMLPPEYEVPTTIAETSKDILVWKKTGERPNGSRWAACTERTVKTDKVSAGDVSCVGHFDGRGLDVNDWFGGRSGVGVGASRKS